MIKIILASLLITVSGWLTARNFDSTVLSSDSGIVVVEFWAPWNSQNEYRWITEFDDVRHFRVDIETNERLIQQYRVKAVPTILIFEDGKLIGRFDADFKFTHPISRNELLRILDDI